MGLFEPKNRWETSDVNRREDAIAAACQWVAMDPSKRQWAPVAATGSMKDYLDENSVVCIENDVGGKNVQKGDLVTYYFSDKYPRVLHKISALNKNAFIPNGTANKHYDGWQSRNQINGIARKVIRFKPVVDSKAKTN